MKNTLNPLYLVLSKESCVISLYVKLFFLHVINSIIWCIYLAQIHYTCWNFMYTKVFGRVIGVKSVCKMERKCKCDGTENFSKSCLILYVNIYCERILQTKQVSAGLFSKVEKGQRSLDFLMCYLNLSQRLTVSSIKLVSD